MNTPTPNPAAQALGSLGGRVRSKGKSEAAKRRWASMSKAERQAFKRRVSSGLRASWAQRKASQQQSTNP